MPEIITATSDAAVNDAVAEYVKRIPGRRWIDYSRKFGQPTQDVMTDAVVVMVVVANEQHLRDHGRQNLEELLEMGMEDLQAHLKAVLLPGVELPEGADFPDDGAAGREPAGSLDAV